MSVKQKIGYCSVAVVLGLVAQLHPNELRTSQEGLELLAGYEDCRNVAYKDIVGIATCGIGSTYGVKMGDVWTDEQVAAAFVRDVRKAEQCVITYFNGKNMPQYVFDSVVSLVYNTGCWGARWNTKLNRATAIASYAVAEDWYKVCYRLGDFIYAGGKVSNGLKNRRAKEQAHCLRYLNAVNPPSPKSYPASSWVPGNANLSWPSY